MRWVATFLLVVASALLPQSAPIVPRDPGLFVESRKPDASDTFFGKGEIPRLELIVDEAGLAALRADARRYVKAKLKENGKTVYDDVAVKLKGAAGSFRELDDQPAFTIDVNKHAEAQEFHGLVKFHLNNSVQDGTWMHEWIASELMAAAGVPAPRYSQARVWLNERDLGVYTLKEGFDKRFLSRHFKKPGGNLYDGGFCTEIDGGIEKDAGKGPDDSSDLRALAEACREPDPQLRWQRIEERLDVDAFLTFVAMELMVGHWDGYSQNVNNYRVYFEPTRGRAYFLPSGMDQIFGDSEASVLDYPNALVAEAVLRNPEWRKRFRARLSALLPLFQVKEKLQARVKATQKRLDPIVRSWQAEQAGELEGKVKDLLARLEAREKSLRDQVKRPEPKTIEFDGSGRARLSGFAFAVEEGDADGEQVTTGGKRALTVVAGKEPSSAVWRKKVMLPQGRYRFVGNVRVDDVVGFPDDPASGAQLRLAGAGRVVGAMGTATWSPLACEFEVLEATRLIEVLVELRAARGKAWFELASLRIERVR